MQAVETRAEPPLSPPPVAPTQPHEDAARRELQALTERLATRTSIVFLARGAVLAFLSVISGGLMIRLFLDSSGLPFYVFGAMGVFAACVVGAAGQLLRGQRLLAGERRDFARLLELRRASGLDEGGVSRHGDVR
ncbi:MAG: hypothetical protein ACK4N5_18415 [Myxococcales bacterium]